MSVSKSQIITHNGKDVKGIKYSISTEWFWPVFTTLPYVLNYLNQHKFHIVKEYDGSRFHTIPIII